MRLIAEVDVRRRLSLMMVALLLIAACVTPTAEQKLSHELFVEAAHECQSRYHTIHVDQIDLEGGLKLHADADSRIEYRPFVACYHEALKARAEALFTVRAP